VSATKPRSKLASFANYFNIHLTYETFHKYLLIVILFSTIFILSGGIYNLTENPIFAHPWAEIGGFHSSLNEQFILESLIVALCLTLGTGSFFLIHYSTKYAYDPYRSISYLILGIILALVATGSIVTMYHYKMNLPLMV
jgi:hypothetical protein